jgi:DNA polymerase
MPILLDTESRSRADLKRIGGRNYWAHPSTEMLCAVMHDTDTGERETWTRGQPRPCMLRRGAVLAAHNMIGFDRFGLARQGWRALDDDNPDTLLDTSEIARAGGIPGALDELASRWLGRAKDKEASRFTVGLSSVKRPPDVSAADWKALTREQKRERGVLPPCGPAELARVVSYCHSDVDILKHGWPKLTRWLDEDRRVSRVDRVINDRGVCFDSQLAERLIECDRRNSQRELEHAARELGAGWSAELVRAVANSPKQFCAHTGETDATKETIDRILASTAGGKSAILARARRALASIARGKLEAGLARVSPDGRLRDTHRYIGGHTWRWSGRGMQLQNMPRPSKRFEEWGDDEVCRLADRVLAGKHNADPDEIDLLLRACIHAPAGRVLVVEDFSGVEARALAWAADDLAALEVFKSGLDVYKIIAAQIFGVPYERVDKAQRHLGKQAELACGYGMGAGCIQCDKGIRHTKCSGFIATAKRAGADLDALGVDGHEVVATWRALHKPIVDFWRRCSIAAHAASRPVAIQSRRPPVASLVGPFYFAPGVYHEQDGVDPDLHVFMPNERTLVYNEMLTEGDDGDRARTYRGGRGRQKLYGGKIVENLIQSACRELLAEALVEAEDRGLCPVMHVHDEIVCEVDAQDEQDARRALHEVMTTVPEWAAGFPLGASGHAGKRYRK